MTRLDTHVVVWLFAGDVDRLGAAARAAIDDEAPTVAAIVELELAFLHEIGRVAVPAVDLLDDLRHRIGLRTSEQGLASVVRFATSQTWTRDPFDRLIVGDALAAGDRLITRDRRVLENVSSAAW